MTSISHRIRNWREIIAEHGAEVAEVEISRHLKFRLSTGHLFVIPATPTDYHSDRNALSQLRRMIGWIRQPKPKRDRFPQPPRKPLRKGWAEDEVRKVEQWRSPGKETVLDARRRERLGLDGPRLEVRVRLNRPILSLPRRTADG